MTLSANVLIAAGASPIMSAAPEEAGELAGMSGALVVNIGTLTHDWIEGARAAVRGARVAGRPWVLDPVGVGATAFRRDTAARAGGARAADHPRQRLGDHGPGRRCGRRQGRRQHGRRPTRPPKPRGALAARHRRRGRGHRCGRPGHRRQPHADRRQRPRAADPHHRLGLRADRPDRRLGRRARRPARGHRGRPGGLRRRGRARGAEGRRAAAASSRRCSTRWVPWTAPPRRGWPGSHEAPLRARPLSRHRPRALRAPAASSAWSARRWRAASPWSSCATM